MSDEPLAPHSRATLQDHLEDFMHAVPFEEAWERASPSVVEPPAPRRRTRGVITLLALAAATLLLALPGTPPPEPPTPTIETPSAGRLPDDLLAELASFEDNTLQFDLEGLERVEQDELVSGAAALKRDTYAHLVERLEQQVEAANAAGDTATEFVAMQALVEVHLDMVESFVNAPPPTYLVGTQRGAYDRGVWDISEGPYNKAMTRFEETQDLADTAKIPLDADLVARVRQIERDRMAHLERRETLEAPDDASSERPEARP